MIRCRKCSFFVGAVENDRKMEYPRIFDFLLEDKPLNQISASLEKDANKSIIKQLEILI
jgi:hypothetical protein